MILPCCFDVQTIDFRVVIEVNYLVVGTTLTMRIPSIFIYSKYLNIFDLNLKNSLIIQEQNTKKNHKRVVVLYVIKNHVNLHKLYL